MTIVLLSHLTHSTLHAWNRDLHHKVADDWHVSYSKAYKNSVLHKNGEISYKNKGGLNCVNLTQNYSREKESTPSFNSKDFLSGQYN